MKTKPEKPNVAADEYEDEYEDDYYGDLHCLHCCGEGMVENDDPIQRGPAAYLKCFSCGGTGKRKDMTVW